MLFKALCLKHDTGRDKDFKTLSQTSSGSISMDLFHICQTISVNENYFGAHGRAQNGLWFVKAILK